jgi:hypothetical protein
MNEFERMIEEARRNAEATASQQQAAQMREEAERAEHQERLRQILRVTPLLADVLTNKPAPTDIELMLRRWQEARKGLRRSTSGRWVEEPYGSGWTARRILPTIPQKEIDLRGSITEFAGSSLAPTEQYLGIRVR